MLKWLKNNLISVLVCAIFVALFFEYNIILQSLYTLTFILFIADFLYAKRWQSWRWTRDKWVYVAWIAFYLLHLLYLPFEQTHGRWEMHILENYLPFLVLGCMGLAGGIERLELHLIGKVVILAALLLPLYVILLGIGISEYLCAISSPTLIFENARNALIGKHIAYDIMLCIAMAFAMWFYTQAQHRKQKIMYLFVVLYVYYFLFISNGRTGFLTGNVLMAAFVILLIWNRLQNTKQYVKYGVLIVMLILSAVCVTEILFSHSRMQHIGAGNPRLLIWNTGIEVAKERPILGYGLNDSHQRFVEIGSQNEPLTRWYKRHCPNATGDKFLYCHLHNQFLQTLTDIGILGVLLLVFFFVFPLSIVPRDRRLLQWLVTIIYAICALVDVFGPYMMPFAFCLLTILCIKPSTAMPLPTCENDSNPSLTTTGGH